MQGYLENRIYCYKNIPEGFNWKDYIELNEDLTTLITTEKQAKSHYEMQGYLENRIYCYKNIPSDFNWKDYIELNEDLTTLITTEKQAKSHYEMQGYLENRIYCYKNIPSDFNWKDYIELNEDLTTLITTEKQAKSHYEMQGYLENRIYCYKNIPSDFNWKDYIELNNLNKITTEKQAKSHYEKYNLQTKLLYKPIIVYKNQNNYIIDNCLSTSYLPIEFDWNAYLTINSDIGKIYSTEEQAKEHYIKYGYYEKRIYCYPNTINSLISLYHNENRFNLNIDLFYLSSEHLKMCKDKEKYIQTDLKSYYDIKNKFNLNNNIINNNYNSYDKNIFINENEIEQNINSIKTQINEIDLNVYNSFLVIFDAPDDIYGGCKTFINTIIYKYGSKNNFLIVKKNHKNNNEIIINISNKYYIKEKYNEYSFFDFLINNFNKIEKIFVNHFLKFSHTFIQKILAINKEKTLITHDQFLFNNLQSPHDLIDIYLNNNNKSNYINYFDNIITQNEQNVYLFNNYLNLKNIIISPLPDYMNSDQIIHTNNSNTVILVIGNISDVKGSELLKLIVHYYRNHNIKFIVLGDVYNKDNKYNIEICKYKNILEFNDLLIKYKPNLILETSLWPETWSYTLTISMLTKLPIISLKKHFPGVIENRLQNYSNSFYFKNVNELANKIKNLKQNFFYTVKPDIYYSTYCDNYFNYNKIDSNIEFKYSNLKDNILNKNIVLITSKIYVSNTSYTYSNIRSVYTPKERFNQTLLTIQSIKKKIPNTFILLFDNSIFCEEEKVILNSNVDLFLNILDNPILNYYTNLCQHKFMADAIQQIYAYLYFIKYLDISKIKYFFKISGRYELNDTFKYELYDNNNNIFKKKSDVVDRDYYYTSFFKINSNYLIEYFDKLINLYYTNIEYINLDLEVIYQKLYYSNMTLINNLGLTERISVWNEINNI